MESYKKKNYMLPQNQISGQGRGVKETTQSQASVQLWSIL